MKMKFTLGQDVFAKIRDDVLSYATEQRMSEHYRGAKDMDVDLLQRDEKRGNDEEPVYTDEDWADWQQYLTDELNYMGVSKGKGWKGAAKPQGELELLQLPRLHRPVLVPRLGLATGARKWVT